MGVRDIYFNQHTTAEMLHASQHVRQIRPGNPMCVHPSKIIFTTALRTESSKEHVKQLGSNCSLLTLKGRHALLCSKYMSSKQFALPARTTVPSACSHSLPIMISGAPKTSQPQHSCVEFGLLELGGGQSGVLHICTPASCILHTCERHTIKPGCAG